MSYKNWKYAEMENVKTDNDLLILENRVQILKDEYLQVKDKWYDTMFTKLKTYNKKMVVHEYNAYLAMANELPVNGDKEK